MYVIWFIIDNKSDNCMIESLIVGSANALLMIKLCMIESSADVIMLVM